MGRSNERSKPMVSIEPISVIKHVVQLLHDFIDTFTALVDFVDYLFSSVKPQYLLDRQHTAFLR